MAAALLAGCAADQIRTVLAPVSPASGLSAAMPPETRTGVLVVYSAFDVNPGINRRDSERPVGTDYQILTADGRPLQFVHNDSGTILQQPVPVKLPAGKYRVVALANGAGRVTVPVIIAPGRLTTVHLEGDLSLAR